MFTKMNVLTALFLTVIVSTASGNVSLWQKWKHSYRKSYKDAKEEYYRYNVWKKNLNLVESHNNRVDKTFSMEMNQFADQTVAQKRSTLKPIKTTHYRNDIFNAHRVVPDSFDWRTKGAVGPVRNQGQFGSASAFATVDCLESFHFIKTGQLVSLSVEEVIDCCNTSFADTLGCIKRLGGLCSEASYPKTTDKKCKSSQCKPIVTINGQTHVPAGDQEALKAAVYTEPVIAVIDASHSSFQLYRSGIYYEPKCSNLHLDHVVLIVGYGSMNQRDYWIVKNSWGQSWGMQGYILMARNTKIDCGVSSMASYPN